LLAPYQSRSNHPPSHWGPSSIPSTAPEALKEPLHGWYAEQLTNDGGVFHALCGNGEELAKQIHEAVELCQHPEYGPPNKDKEDATEEGNDALDAIGAGEEAQSPRHSDGQGEAGEEEDVAQGEHGGIKQKQTAEEQKYAPQDHEARADFCIVADHGYCCTTCCCSEAIVRERVCGLGCYTDVNYASEMCADGITTQSNTIGLINLNSQVEKISIQWGWLACTLYFIIARRD
jgi:hypothetical protein